MSYIFILVHLGFYIQKDPLAGVLNMFSEEQLEVFGAFSLVIIALLWFIGYLILQVRSYKNLYQKEVKYTKALTEAEAERSRMALQTMEKVRQTMESHLKKTQQDQEKYLSELQSLKEKKKNS